MCVCGVGGGGLTPHIVISVIKHTDNNLHPNSSQQQKLKVSRPFFFLLVLVFFCFLLVLFCMVGFVFCDSSFV